jgi:structure-specific recognition protein 1
MCTYLFHKLLIGFRVGNAMGTARTFDLTITPKSGAEYTFSAVNRDQHESMENFLKAKKVKVTSQMADEVLAELVGDEDDDDEEMQSVASSGDDEPTVRRGADVDEDSEDGMFSIPISDKTTSLTDMF